MSKRKKYLNFKLSNLNKELQNAQNDINECNNFLSSYVEQINSLTQLKLQYSDMIVDIGQLINTLEYNNDSVKSLLNVIDSINFK